MEKIVVTGYRVIAPNANNIEQFLYNLTNGMNGLETVKNLSPKGEKTIVGKIKDSLQEFKYDKQFKRFPRVTLMGIAAGKEAISKAKLKNLQDKKAGVLFGTSLGAIGEKTFQ